MKRSAMTLAATVLFAAGAMAQAQTAGQANTAANTPNSTTLASGTAINAELSSTVDSKKAKAGDEVKAKITEPVTSNGQAVLPRGTQLIGHVTEASARGKGENESALGIVFDKAVLKHGEEISLSASIQALATGASPMNYNGAPMETGPSGSTGAPGGGGMSGGGRSPSAAPNTGAPNTGGNMGSYPTATTNNTGQPDTAGGANGGLDANGHLAPNSRGVYGLEGLSLNIPKENNGQGSVVTSKGKNVRLDSGTKMLLVTQSGANGAQRPGR